MSILETIRADMKLAMRNKDSLRLGVTRGIVADCKNLELIKGELTEDAVVGVIAKLVKQTTEAIADYETAARQDLVQTETVKLDILNSYLPNTPSLEELNSIIDNILHANPDATISDLGQLMGQLKNELPARSDLKHVSAYLREKLSR